MMDFLQRLASFLDRPLFPWKKLILGFSIGQYVFETLLTLRQYSVLQRTKPPAVLASEIPQATFDKSQAYGRAKARFEIVSGLYAQLQNVYFIQADVLPRMWAWAGALVSGSRWLGGRAAGTGGVWGEISQSVVFVLAFILVQQVMNLPTRLYGTFVLEERFGFNKQTARVFVADMVKTNALTAVLAPPILAAFVKIIRATGQSFVLYLWVFAAALQLFLTTAYPVFIQPLFNKLSPLQPGALKSSVEALAATHAFPLHELFVIDGSKRSAHSNAYFYGLPWKKHIVIYDTLLDKMDTPETMAILAHELGHWKLGHTTRLFAIAQVHLLYVFSLFSLFMNNASLYAAFGFHDVRPVVIGFILFSDALAPMDSLIKLALNILSRRFEFQADDFAKSLGYRANLASSLIKLHAQNLSTMDADWAYATYHFSHPHLSERLKALDWKPTEKEDQDAPDAVAKVTGRDEL